MKSNYHSAAFSKLLENEFYGYLFVNERPSGIHFEYTNDQEMRILGLLPENPPYLHIRKNSIQYSYDGKKFETDEEIGFQIFKMFDPRILASEKFRPLHFEEDQMSLSLDYDITQMPHFSGLHEKFIQRLIQNNDHIRTCHLLIKNGMIKVMKQFSIYPSGDIFHMFFFDKKPEDEYHIWKMALNEGIGLGLKSIK